MGLGEDTPTVRIGDRYPDEQETEQRRAAAHARKPGLWLPLVVFVALLVGGALVGRFVVPTGTPEAASPTTTPAGGDTSGPPASAPPPLTGLPTPPNRPADGLAEWATQISGSVDIPAVAVQAYGYAQLYMQQNDAQCHLGWTTVAGIAEVESHHGQAAGAVLATTGRSTPVILGPVLDGKSGRALVRDTDAGAFDGNASFDRTMGAMHLTPSVWRTYALDADGDGIVDPYDIDDATLAMARLLCAGNDDLAALAGWRSAVARYHPGAAYASSVFKAADSYGQRTRSIG